MYVALISKWFSPSFNTNFVLEGYVPGQVNYSITSFIMESGFKIAETLSAKKEKLPRLQVLLLKAEIKIRKEPEAASGELVFCAPATESAFVSLVHE